jgi:hypothetical protein
MRGCGVKRMNFSTVVDQRTQCHLFNEFLGDNLMFMVTNSSTHWWFLRHILLPKILSCHESVIFCRACLRAVKDPCSGSLFQISKDSFVKRLPKKSRSTECAALRSRLGRLRLYVMDSYDGCIFLPMFVNSPMNWAACASWTCGDAIVRRLACGLRLDGPFLLRKRPRDLARFVFIHWHPLLNHFVFRRVVFVRCIPSIEIKITCKISSPRPFQSPHCLLTSFWRVTPVHW